MSRNIMKIEAVKALKSDAQLSQHGEELIWHDGNPTNITNSQIETKVEELQATYDAEVWKRNRQTEYPDAIECVHALLDGGDTLTELQTQRTAIKNKYPKP